MNIGIFAGTFDPIHAGHIHFAQEAIAQAGLDKVVIVAEKEPYRKKPYASWDHRQAMIEHATEKTEGVDHDYGFAAQLSHQHTMKNMLATARSHYGPDNQYWFLVGSDIYEHMHAWQDVAHDSEYAGFVVALRDDHTNEWLQSRQTEAGKQGIGGSIKIISNPKPHISSSKIRNAVKDGQTVDELSVAVQEYIINHHLYSS